MMRSPRKTPHLSIPINLAHVLAGTVRVAIQADSATPVVPATLGRMIVVLIWSANRIASALVGQAKRNAGRDQRGRRESTPEAQVLEMQRCRKLPEAAVSETNCDCSRQQ